MSRFARARRARLWLPLALATLVSAGTGACHDAGARAVDSGSARRGDAQPPVDLPPVTLPPLDGVDAVVRDQIQEGFAALDRVRTDPRATPAMRAEAFGTLGRLLFAARFHTPAEAAFRHAESLAPGERRWPYFLGHLYKGRGAQADAASAFQRAVDLDPRDVPATIWLAEMRLVAGDLAAAEPLFTRAAATDGGRLAAHFGLGRVALGRRDYARAVEHFEAALAAAPAALSVHAP
ncbi:MAG: tetratricopeptide repeat protein, partial [Vicinamibacterales bacterium]